MTHQNTVGYTACDISNAYEDFCSSFFFLIRLFILFIVNFSPLKYSDGTLTSRWMASVYFPLSTTEVCFWNRLHKLTGQVQNSAKRADCFTAATHEREQLSTVIMIVMYLWQWTVGGSKFAKINKTTSSCFNYPQLYNHLHFISSRPI